MLPEPSPGDRKAARVLDSGRSAPEQERRPPGLQRVRGGRISCACTIIVAYAEGRRRSKFYVLMASDNVLVTVQGRCRRIVDLGKLPPGPHRIGPSVFIFSHCWFSDGSPPMF